MVSASKLASERVQLDLFKLALSFAPQGERVSIFTLPVEMSTPATTCARASRPGTLNSNAWTTRIVRAFCFRHDVTRNSLWADLLPA